MKNTISTTTPTLENLKRELARADAEWTRQLMGDALGPIRVARERYEAILAQIAEEERQIAYHNSLRTAWVGNLDHQRLANDAMGGM